jgi:hypothetical protein
MAEKTQSTKEGIKKTCFVITPIGKETEPIRRHVDGIVQAVLEPVLKEQNYDVTVPHYMSTPGSIDKQIIKQIYQSDLVIANLTDVNPNVMYELALRHCFGTPLIIIAERNTVLPFDIGNQRTIFYDNDAMGVLTLRTDLANTIKELTHNGDYESPILSVIKELGVEESIIKDKAVNSDNSEANAWSLLFERLDRLEQRIYNLPKENEIKNHITSSNQLERVVTIIGKDPIDFNIKQSLKHLLESMQIEYLVENDSDGTRISIVTSVSSSRKWKNLIDSIAELCKPNNLDFDIVIRRKY